MKNIQSTKHNNYTLFAYLIIGLHVVANSIWILLNKGPSLYDAAWHTVHAYRIADYFKQFPQINLFQLFEMNNYHPPLVFWGGAIAALVTNYSENGVRFVGTIALALTLYYIFQFTKSVTNARVAFFATVFSSLSIFFYRESRMFMLDVPLIASIFATLYYTVKTEYFSKIVPIILLGIALGAAMLIKWTALVFIAPFALWYCYISYKRNTKQVKIIASKVLLIIAIAAFLSLPWYIHVYKDLIAQASLYSKGENDDPFGFGSDNLLYYFRSLVQLGISFSGLLLFVYSCYTLFKKKVSYIYTTPIFWTLAIVYGLFTFIVGNKNGRYLMPLVPFLTIIMGIGVDYTLARWRERVVGVFFSILTIGYLLLAFFVNSFAVPFYPKYEEGVTLPFGLGWVNIYMLNTKWEYIKFNSYTDTQSSQAADILVSTRAQKGSDIVYFATSLMPYFQEPTIAIKLAEKQGKAHGGIEHLYTGAQILPEDGSVLSEDILRNYINKADIVFLMKGQFGYSTGDRSYKPREQIQNLILNGNAPQFCKTSEITIEHADSYNGNGEGNNTVLVYKNTNRLSDIGCK
jgi:4-amino-4-deoxy-L-arabinose transferase-like glycosyltransferase